MGFLSTIKSRYRMSQAAVVVQNLLEPQVRLGLLEGDPAFLANKLVALVWAEKPTVFDGKFGLRPHKISVAAISLANGMNIFSHDKSLKNAFLIALAEILKELSVNGGLYPFNNLDHELLNRAALALAKEAENAESTSIVTPAPIQKKWEILRVVELLQFSLNVPGESDEKQETWTFTYPKTGASVLVTSNSGETPFVLECSRTKSRQVAETIDRAVFLVGEILGVQKT